jgi:hypothetical protein
MVRGLLKAELKRRDLSYADLVRRLADLGLRDNPRNVSNKISRGTFSAVFLFQCLEALGVRVIHLDNNPGLVPPNLEVMSSKSSVQIAKRTARRKHSGLA